jgi:hypothetical protein
MIIKNIFGTLDVDVEVGKIWINTIYKNVLRISGLKFKNNLDKFTSIDIVNGEAYLINDRILKDGSEEENKELIGFLIRIGHLLHQDIKLFKEEEYEELWHYINQFIKNRKED